MKKLIAILALALVTSASYAKTEGVTNFCAAQAAKACLDATYDYQVCFEEESADCEDYHNTYSKSVPACIQECQFQASRDLMNACLATCKPL